MASNVEKTTEKRVLQIFDSKPQNFKKFGSIIFDSDNIAWEVTKRTDLDILVFESEPSLMSITDAEL